MMLKFPLYRSNGAKFGIYTQITTYFFNICTHIRQYCYFQSHIDKYRKLWRNASCLLILYLLEKSSKTRYQIYIGWHFDMFSMVLADSPHQQPRESAVGSWAQVGECSPGSEPATDRERRLTAQPLFGAHGHRMMHRMDQHHTKTYQSATCLKYGTALFNYLALRNTLIINNLHFTIISYIYIYLIESRNIVEYGFSYWRNRWLFMHIYKL